MTCRLVVFACLFLFAACGGKRELEGVVPAEAPDRIVSMAPSITECVFAAGGGERLVGVTSFCNYPPEAAELPRIGGYSDANFERIYGMQPDLAILLEEHVDAGRRLESLGIRWMKVDTARIGGILATVEELGGVFGTEEVAAAEVARLQGVVDGVRAKAAGVEPKRVLVSIGRNMGTGGLTDVYVAGGNTIYQEMLEVMGAENVYGGSMEYAKMSRESIMRLNPDVIIDLIPDLETTGKLKREDVVREWDVLKEVEAVKQGRVHVLGNDYVCIPGPRFALTLRDIAAAVYPEVFEEP
ncbi:MAG: ABC transporter substrate-binding protein [Verrucomicrobiota bacterium JB025]|nr:helical backbone metal receptor [Verrucomicrobiota bacterium JB025]